MKYVPPGQDGSIVTVAPRYHQYPAGGAFGGYQIPGIGRENHRMMLDQYSQTKNLLVSYGDEPLGLF